MAIWRRWDGAKWVIQAATRPPGGSWGAPADLSAADQNSFEPQVAIDDDGEAVAVWRHYNGTYHVIQYATKPAAADWTAPMTFADTNHASEDPRVAVDGDGDVIVVWRHSNGTTYVVRAASRPASGPWEPPVDVSTTDVYAVEPQVAIGGGNAVAVWRDNAGATVQVATKAPFESWAAPTSLNATGEVSDAPQVAIGPGGEGPVAVWEGREDLGSYWTAHAASGIGAGWGGSTAIGPATADEETPQITIDDDGEAVAVWRHYDGTPWVIEAAAKPAGGSWGASTYITAPAEYGDTPALAGNGDGDAVAVWLDYGGSVRAAVKPDGAPWEAPSGLAPEGESDDGPQIAISSDGSAVAVWADLDSGTIKAVNLAAGYGGDQGHLEVVKSGAGSGVVTSAPSGINCGTECLAAFDTGTEVTLSAAPGPGSEFGGWSGACGGAGACAVTVQSTLSVTADFEPAGAQLPAPPAEAQPPAPPNPGPQRSSSPTRTRLRQKKLRKALKRCRMKSKPKAKAKCVKRARAKWGRR